MCWPYNLLEHQNWMRTCCTMHCVQTFFLHVRKRVGRMDNFWHYREWGYRSFFGKFTMWIDCFKFFRGWGQNPPPNPPLRSAHAYAIKRGAQLSWFCSVFLQNTCITGGICTWRAPVACRVFYFPHVCPFYCNTCKTDW